MATTSRTRMLIPSHLISIYQNDKNQSYAELSTITTKGKVGVFKPLTLKDAQQLSKIFHDQVTGFRYDYNPNILVFDKKDINLKIIFKTDPEKKMHIYVNGLNLKSGLRPVPGLIWTYRGSLQMYAYKEFKGPETELYRAPFMNITDENVCLGSSKIHIDHSSYFSINEAVKIITDGFWNSAFSHATTGKQVEGNLHELSDELDRMNHFPVSMLVPFTKIDEKGNEIPKLLKDIL